MPENNFKKYALHIFLFVLTLATTTMAGAEWIGIRELGPRFESIEMAGMSFGEQIPRFNVATNWSPSDF